MVASCPRRNTLEPATGKQATREEAPVSEERKALIRRQEEELFGRGNLELADEIYAPDYVGHDPSNIEDVRGLEAAKRAAADYR
jgi:hypothetical protein